MDIKVWGQYYYRGEDHVPRRITIVEEGPTKGFYWCVNGHYTKEELMEKKQERFLIHRNRIVQ